MKIQLYLQAISNYSPDSISVLGQQLVATCSLKWLGRHPYCWHVNITPDVLAYQHYARCIGMPMLRQMCWHAQCIGMQRYQMHWHANITPDVLACQHYARCVGMPILCPICWHANVMPDVLACQCYNRCVGMPTLCPMCWHVNVMPDVLACQLFPNITTNTGPISAQVGNAVWVGITSDVVTSGWEVKS